MNSKRSCERNTMGLIAHAQKKAALTRQRVSDTLDQLLREEEIVNFNTVAKAAGVTKSYLYNQPDLRERIDAVRLLQGQERLFRLSKERKECNRTDKSKDVLLAAKERRIRELEVENQRLKEELKKLHGKLYETT